MSSKVILETAERRYMFSDIKHLSDAFSCKWGYSETQLMFRCDSCFDKVERKFLKNRSVGCEYANEVLEDSGLV